MSELIIGTRATCKACGEAIEWRGMYWYHVDTPSGIQSRHPAKPQEEQSDKWLRVAKALDVFQTGIWPSEEDVDDPALVAYVNLLKQHYTDLRCLMGFQAAAWAAKAALFRKVEQQ